MRPVSIMIARFPGMNQEHPDSAGYVMGLMETLHNDMRIDKILPYRISDTPITMSRNRCVKAALDANIDYILMIDADMSPDCEPGAPPFWETAWEFMMDRRRGEDEDREMLAHAFDMKEGDPYPSEASKSLWRGFAPATIAAPYCGPPPHECVYVFRWAGKSTGDADPAFKLEMFDRDDAARKHGIEEVAALPTGLILYDTRVFRKLPVPWFEYEWTDNYRMEKASTEDVYQTRNASLMGMPQFCTWDCWAGHIKTKKVVKPQPMTVKAIRREFAEALRRGER